MSGRIISDSNIVNAISKYLKANNMNAYELAAKCGVSAASFCKWRRVGSGIRDQQWQVLFPLIKPYLPPCAVFKDDSGNDTYASTTQHVSQYYFNPKYVPIIVPVLNESNIAGFNHGTESPMQYAHRMRIADNMEYHYYTEQMKRQDILCFRLWKDTDGFINGTNFFASPSLPQQEDGLCLVYIDERVRPLYVRNELGKLRFTDAAHNIIFAGSPAELQGRLKWIFPVIYFSLQTYSFY